MVSDSVKERNELLHRGSLHWFHWLAVGASLLLTLAAWFYSKRLLEEKVHAQFSRESDQVIRLLVERMQKYEDGLWGGVGALRANGDTLLLPQWQAFAASLSLDKKYPGINGIGIIHRVKRPELPTYLAEQRLLRSDFRTHPAHSHSELFPITFVEPLGPNKQAVGLDMAHEENRYTAVLKARDSGKARVTGPIVLVQDAQQTPGFLFYAPFYAQGRDATLQQRRKNFLGLVYAPFVVNKLMEGALSKRNRHIGLRIVDATETLYDENTPGDSEYDAAPQFQSTREVELYGRLWRFEIQSTLSFREAAHGSQPLTILIGGLLIDALLLGLFLFLARGNRNAIQYADQVNASLLAQTGRLEQSIQDLQQFAYVTSHDLKAPLRAMTSLVEWISEDLNDPSAREDVKRNLDLLNGRAVRMVRLVEGILDYSRLGASKRNLSEVDVAELVKDIRATELAPDTRFRVQLAGPLPILLANETLIRQVLANLISNAVKHHDRSYGTVELNSAPADDDFVAISVADDGPGIPPEFHTRVFAIFQTLQPRDRVEGTGIGLSVVQKIVVEAGGKIWIESDGERGTTFFFTWPVDNGRKNPSSQVA